MKTIKTIVFDLGGVVFAIDRNQALNRFNEIGFTQASQYLDEYEQQGFCGDLEAGRITAEEFRNALSALIGKEVTLEQCARAWQGYHVETPPRNLDALLRLRREGYRVCLLSNTNPFMMDWARSKDFDGGEHGIEHYFDALYLSYEMKAMKPHRRIFEMMLQAEHASPETTLFLDDSPHNVEAAEQLGIRTLQPKGANDWIEPLMKILYPHE